MLSTILAAFVAVRPVSPMRDSVVVERSQVGSV